MRLILLTLFLAFSYTHAIAKDIHPQGEFSKIDINQQNIAVQELLKGNNTYITKVLKSPEQYSPPVLYALSHILFKKEKKEEAMFWFYAGQIRARSDANKSLDISARQAVSVLNRKFGALINRYAFKNIPKLKATVEKVIIWDNKTTRKYDPKWISLHGMDAFTKKKIAFEPKEKWEKINESTRKKYIEGFRKAMAKMEKKS